jgi:hypothetical protein
MFTKTRYIPEGYELKYTSITLKIDVWALKISENQYIVKCFLGKAIKPAWVYNLTWAGLEQKIKQQVESCKAREKMKAEYKAKRSMPVVVNVGDIFKSSWGFEQTNIDYYEVTKIVSPTMIEVTPIAAAKVETQWLAGQCTPVKGQFVGEPMRKKVQGYEGKPSFKIASYATADLLEPTGFENGQPVYPSSYWSAYA